jgi:hypothetical protein
MPNTNTNIKVTGIMIGANHKDFKLYEISERLPQITQADGTNTSTSGSGSTWVEGYSDILRVLAQGRNAPEAAINRFVIVYDVSCPNKEEHLNKLLKGINGIKKNDLLPSLYVIGHEQSPLNEVISKQVSVVKEVANSQAHDKLFEQIIEKEVVTIRQELLAILNLEKKRNEFTLQLNIIATKAAKLRHDGYITAAEKAEQLHTNLSLHSKTYFDNPTKEAYGSFYNKTKKELETAHQELDKHRGWKRVLGNIGLAILGFGVIYIAAVLINKNMFFNKTDSAEKLDALEVLVDKDTYQMN